jgi:hypothetical protein
MLEGYLAEFNSEITITVLFVGILCIYDMILKSRLNNIIQSIEAPQQNTIKEKEAVIKMNAKYEQTSELNKQHQTHKDITSILQEMGLSK